MKIRWLRFLIFILITGFFFTTRTDPVRAAVSATAEKAECDPPGWFPTEFGLMDHSVFYYDGYYYIVSNLRPAQTKFAYARSVDFCTWEDMGPILTYRDRGDWDGNQIWAPSVYEENGTYYMVYTGVTVEMTQSILLATTTTPDDPESWVEQGMIFQPSHEDMIWENEQWADCRDPMIIKQGDIYYMSYTGQDVQGGIIGVATAQSIAGPWSDWGAMVGPISGKVNMMESSTIVQRGNAFYLFYNLGYVGEFFRSAPGPTGPWSDPIAFPPGWANEVWQTIDGTWYSSYLTDYTVTISPLHWSDSTFPPRPYLLPKARNGVYLPFIIGRPR